MLYGVALTSAVSAGVVMAAIPATVALLCFVMGLQNAIVTKASRAEIRTTHVTGLLTDFGIELGKLVYVNASPSLSPVLANRPKLKLQGQLIGSFLLGGLVGAMGFKQAGFIMSLPLAAVLLALVLRPVWTDLQQHLPPR